MRHNISGSKKPGDRLMSAESTPPASRVHTRVKRSQLGSLALLKLPVTEGSLKWRRRVVNVYTRVTLIVAGIY